MLKVGDRAPAIAGRDQRGRAVDLPALLRRGPVVLYFYPKDFTLVCTRQACMFRDAHAEFSSMGAEIIGVSLDDGDTHARFAREHDLPFSLLPDTDKKIARDYDVLNFLGVFTKRVTYVIEPGGTIATVIHHELSAAKHISKVRAVLETLPPVPEDHPPSS